VEADDLDALIDHVAESTVGKSLSQNQPPHRRHRNRPPASEASTPPQ